MTLPPVVPPAVKDPAQPASTKRAPDKAKGSTSLSKGRNLARRCAVQALYQWQLTQQNVSDIDAQFVTEHDIKKVDIPYFQELLHQVPAHVTELDARTSVVNLPIEDTYNTTWIKVECRTCIKQILVCRCVRV